MNIPIKKYFLLFLVLILVSCRTSRISTAPDISDVSNYHYILAVEAELSNDWEEALKHLGLALKENPGSPYLKTEIGRIYLKMDMIAEAIHSTEHILNKVPDYRPAISLLSSLYTRQKDYPRAIEMYKKLIRIEPGKNSNYLHLAYLYQLISRPDEAITALMKITERDPYNYKT